MLTIVIDALFPVSHGGTSYSLVYSSHTFSMVVDNTAVQL